MAVEELTPFEGYKGQTISWVDLMALEKVADRTFKSKVGTMTGAFINIKGVRRPTTFGGHQSAQAVWAAAQTVPEGFVVHSVTGYFTSRGLADRPLIYHVRTIKDGRNYCQRAVEVTQDGSSNTTFSNICSFKRANPNDRFTFQDQVDIQGKYSSVTKGRHPADLPEQRQFESHNDFFGSTQLFRTPNFAGLHVSMIPMQDFNKNRHPLDKRTLFAYAVQGSMPPVSTHANLHAAMHIYAADREAGLVIARHLEVLQHAVASGSLSQTVVFHGGAELLTVLPADGDGRKEKWLFQEGRTDRMEDGRATHYSRIFDERGRHVASSSQDFMLQLKFKTDEDMNRTMQGYAPSADSVAATRPNKL